MRTKCSFATFGPVVQTRFPELAYQRQGANWRIVDAESKAAIGMPYGTRAELLADLDRYAAAFGCN